MCFVALCYSTGVPDPPRNVRITKCDANQAVVTWEEPATSNNDPVISYTVYYQNVAEKDFVVGAQLIQVILR